MELVILYNFPLKSHLHIQTWCMAVVYDTLEPSSFIDIDPALFCGVIFILKAAKCLILSSTEERKRE